MSAPSSLSAKIYQGGSMVLSWFALTGQLYLILENRTTSVTEVLLRYFGFFTILTNMLVALCFTALLLRKGKFFQQAGTQAAIAVYILIVGLVYNTLLRFLWQPQGLQRWVDELLHVVVPLLYLCYWLIYGSSRFLAWKNAFAWLLYPLAYILYTLFRGSVDHYYPYPFLDVDKLGYPAVLATCLLLTFAFLGISLLFVAISRWKNSGSPAIKA